MLHVLEKWECSLGPIGFESHQCHRHWGYSAMEHPVPQSWGKLGCCPHVFRRLLWLVSGCYLPENHNFSQVSISSQVALELDRRIAYTWSASFGHEIYAAPFGGRFHSTPWWSLWDRWFCAWEDYFEGFVMDLKLHFTLSPPCPAWSRGGKSFGLHAPDGWDFLEVVHLCLLGKPLACVFECSDDVDKHAHFVHVKHAVTTAGFTMVVSQNVTAHELTNNSRTRWFGIWLRNDVATPPFTLPKLPAKRYHGILFATSSNSHHISKRRWLWTSTCKKYMGTLVCCLRTREDSLVLFHNTRCLKGGGPILGYPFLLCVHRMEVSTTSMCPTCSLVACIPSSPSRMESGPLFLPSPLLRWWGACNIRTCS